MITKEDFDFLERILPKSYQVIKYTDADIQCKSPEGIWQWSKKKDGTKFKDEDEEAWGYILKAIKQQFGDRFEEVYHSVCTFHKDFDIFLKREQK